MKLLWPCTALLGLTLLSGCMPAPLRPQERAQVHVQTALAGDLVRASTGETIYRFPDPAQLAVRADRDAFVTVVVLPEDRMGQPQPSGGALVSPAQAVKAGETALISTPAVLGFTQVFTVVSLQPLDLTEVAGERTVSSLARKVGELTRTLPQGSFNVETTVYRVSRFGSLEVSASEWGARVSVGGRHFGTFVGRPLLIPHLPEGSVQVHVEKDGFVPWNGMPTVLPDQVVAVEAQLRRPIVRGTLRIESRVKTRVTISGRGERRLQEVFPGVSAEIVLPVGPYTVELLPSSAPAGVMGTVLPVVIRAERATIISCTDVPNFTCQVK